MALRKQSIFAIASASLLGVIIGAATGYYFAEKKQGTRTSAAIFSSMTVGHVFGERKEIDLLSQLASYKGKESEAMRRTALCGLLDYKMQSINTLHQQYKELYRSHPELKETSVASDTITTDVELAEQAMKRSSCTKN